MANDGWSRRDFLQRSVAGAAAAGVAGWAARRAAGEDAPGDPAAGDVIGVGVIGCGGQANGYHITKLLDLAKNGAEKLQVRGVCDIYEPRKKRARERTGAEVYHDYRELLKRADIHAVHVCTPDHWHFQMCKDALEAGKDVYCEKPVTLTWEEAKALRDLVRKTKRVFQCGVQTTSEGVWWKAGELIREGVAGKLLWSQTCFCRNTRTGMWNYPIDADASGKNLDWESFLGPAPKIPFNAEHYFRWRKYWPYSGGIATDLFFHQLGHLACALGPGELPVRVVAAGGIYQQPDRDVPDTYATIIDYAGRHSVVISSSMSNWRGFMATRDGKDDVIRGNEATLFFKGRSVVVEPEAEYVKEFKDKHKGRAGYQEKEGGDPVLEVKEDWRVDHIQNFYQCVRSRKTPNCSIDHAYAVMVAIHLGVLAYRQNKVMLFDPGKEQII